MHAKFKPVGYQSVEVNDPFWSPRIETNREVTMAQQYKQLTGTGRIANLWKAGGKLEGAYEGYRFNDSDVYKWIEAAAYVLAKHPDPELQKNVDEAVDAIEAAQQSDGYINSYYRVAEPKNRWTNLAMNHELYCAGHLFEAAAELFLATGQRRLLDVALRFAEYINSLYGPGKKVGFCGHPELELALMKLYRATGDEKWMKLSQRMVDERGKRPSPFDAELQAEDLPRNQVDWKGMFMKGDEYSGEYCQDHLPVREQTEVVGHAVRAMYLFCGMTDLAMETGDETLVAALNRLWANLTEKRMYVTGGIGPSKGNEGFTTDYDLPNEEAYAETCAAIGLVLWAHRMLQLHGEAKFADVMELALYNGVISGVALDGEHYFYVNPLESAGGHHRQGWFGCACCPPNITRLLASLGGYVLGTTDDALWVNLYIGGKCRAQVGSSTVGLTVNTNYPWTGDVELLIQPETVAAFELRLRIPGWCESAGVWVNGEPQHVTLSNGYLGLRREWQPGDAVRLSLAMEPHRLTANPNVKADIGRAAVQRGPIVYCLEAVDNHDKALNLVLPWDAILVSDFEPDLMGGVGVLRARGLALDEKAWHGKLYVQGKAPTDPVQMTFVPYCCWDNRQPGEMAVWVPVG